MTDSYERRCAISGEKTLPILDAAHIRAYDAGGEHTPSNGLLLRTDIHRLFDLGYVTIGPDVNDRGIGTLYFRAKGTPAFGCERHAGKRPIRRSWSGLHSLIGRG